MPHYILLTSTPNHTLETMPYFFFCFLVFDNFLIDVQALNPSSNPSSDGPVPQSKGSVNPL